MFERAFNVVENTSNLTPFTMNHLYEWIKLQNNHIQLSHLLLGVDFFILDFVTNVNDMKFSIH